jgi:glutamine synthetase
MTTANDILKAIKDGGIDFANPYLGFAAMLMAGLDGIGNQVHPGEPMDKDLYDLPPEELRTIPTSVPACGKRLKASIRIVPF